VKALLVFWLVVFAAITNRSFGQGTIFLDNINTLGPYVTYGAPGIPANGVSGAPGTVGAFLPLGWTMGFYYALGNVTGSVASDPTGTADPSTLGGGLILATGPGSTGGFALFGGDRGGVVAGSFFSVPGTSSAGGDTVTLIVVAYNSSAGSYANAPWRGHSTAYTMTTSSSTSSAPNPTGQFMSAFSVFPVPEPSAFALASLVGFTFLFFRSRRRVLKTNRNPT
jgi:hypothetical protein